MPTCEHCQDILLDSVYGLLEETELQEMHAHLSACSRCQAELERVQAQQKLLARAAHAITEVRAFSLPSEAIAAAPQVTPITAPASVPLQPHAGNDDSTQAPQSRRALWRRPWVAWATAAAVLLAVSASLSLYRHTVQTLQSELAAQKLEQNKIEQQFAAVPAQYHALQHAAIQTVRAEISPYLHVVGPTQLQADAKANVYITTRQVEGEPAPARLQIKLVEAGTEQVVQERRIDSDGRARIELDASGAKAGSKLDLVVVADTKNGQASLRETMQAPAPSYVTRIDINKLAYPIRDVLFFRVLVLDRYSLRPPSRPVMVRVKLLNPKNDIVRQAMLPSGDGGILAGEWAIEENFLAGPYALQVGPAEEETVPVQLASQRLEVIRDLRVPAIQFDQQRYAPGDALTGVLNGGGGSPTPEQVTGRIGNQAVPVTIQQEARTQAARPGLAANAGQAGNNKQDAHKGLADGNAMAQRRFTTKIPTKLPADAKNLPFTIQLQGDKRKEEFSAVVPLASTDYSIDFFPEGGDLIAGVANRVFYRVRTRSGEAVTGAGRVILMTSKNDIVDSPYQHGLGYIDFTPQAKETYTVRITSAAKTNEVAQPFATLGIRTSGVVLHVPDAVGKQGEPVRLTLRNQAPPRQLMLVAQCRGQIVDQRWFDIKTGSLDCTLQTSETHGMIRVTAYEVQGQALEPVAERLVYRIGSARLDLGLTLNTQQYQPGRRIQGRISARNENGAPAQAWLLASVVDERFQPRPASLAAHFLLLNEIRSGADLDDVPLILHDSPESIQVLETFLGTHGWRRFVRAQEPVALAQGGRANDGQPNASAPMVFSRENTSLETLQKEYSAKLASVLMPLNQRAIKEQIEAEDLRQRSADAVYLAALRLRNCEEKVQLGIRLSLGIFVASMLGLSLILLGVGGYRIVRGHKVGTPAFAGAFACLAVCLIVMLLGQSLGPIDDAISPVPTKQAPFAGGNPQRLDQQLAQAPMLRHGNEPPAGGAYAMRSEQQDDQARGKAEMKDAKGSLRRADVAIHEQLARSITDRDRIEGAAAPQQDRGIENKMMNQRFEGARAQQFGNRGGGNLPVAPQPTMSPAAKASVLAKSAAIQEKASPATVAQAPAAGVNEQKAKKLDEQARQREYAHTHAPNLITDTLLWSPALVLPNGTADMHFDIASGQATYRVLLLGHTATGRFGYHEMHLDVPETSPQR